VAELEEAPDGLGASELRRRLGLHENTIRWHLGVLADAGLVRSEPEPRGAPGRPRILYTLTRRERRAAEACEEAGRAWGSELVQGRERRRGEEVRAVVRILSDQGFEPAAADDTVTMHRCPLRGLAEANPDVICALHRGLIDGALRELGSPLAVSRLEVFPRPDVCVAHIARVRG
jgi:predicted ArsR family transcriptional regulator